MKKTGNINLILFFTEGMSLESWAKLGMLAREAAIYRRLVSKGINCSFVTYGQSNEANYLSDVKGINVIYNSDNLLKSLYKKTMPFLNLGTFLRADIFKTNQISGSKYALTLKKIFRKKLIARCGWIPSMFAQKGFYPLEKINKLKNLEQLVFRGTDKIIVTTEFMKKYVVEQYHTNPDKIEVIPNYVDTDLFSPKGKNKIKNRICTLGKNHPQKNFLVLLKALRNMKNIELVMIGEASNSIEMKEAAKKYNINVKFLGNISSEQVAQEFNKSDFFVLPSLYEGHPKALLEAMACGLCVIGTDVEGINNIIAHNKNGYLCQTSPKSIKEAIEHVLRDDELRQRLGREARKYVVEHCSLERIVEAEIKIYEKLIK